MKAKILVVALAMLVSGFAQAEKVRDIGQGAITLERANQDVYLTFNNSKPQLCKKESFDPETRQAYPQRVWNCGQNVRVSVGQPVYGTSFRGVYILINQAVIYDARINYPE